MSDVNTLIGHSPARTTDRYIAPAVDLTPWGYAPGGYLIKCVDCPPDMTMVERAAQSAAKRAWRCEKHALEAREKFGNQPPEAADERLVTITISIARNGDVHEDTQTHGNIFADVYRGLNAVRGRLDEVIANRKQCPYNPKDQK